MAPWGSEGWHRRGPDAPAWLQTLCAKVSLNARSTMERIAALVTCHNRRSETVASLRSLGRALGRVDGVAVEVFLTDDGSTDGTAEAVQKLGLPVRVVRGNGNLYWNRGMVKAWKAALASMTEFDGYLLLNDDTTLDEGALAQLLDACRELEWSAIVVGAVRDPASARVTYGGVRRTSRWHPGRLTLVAESTDMQRVDAFNGNCVLVPARVSDRVGMLDDTFTHGMGDFDLGLRASREGVPVVVAPGTVGSCARNDVRGTWRDPALSVRSRLRLLESPKGLPRREWRTYLRRHGAPLPWLLAFAPTAGVLVSSFRRRLVARRWRRGVQ